MAQINFPTATSNGQTFEADNGVIYTYVGTPPNGFWSGSFQATGLTTLDARFLKLDSSNDPLTGGLNVTGGSDTTNTGATLLIDDSATTGPNVGGIVGFRGSDGTTQRTYGLIKGGKETAGSNFNGYLSFQTRENGQSNTTEHVRIDSSGNMGIGTDSPDQKLDVNGGNLIVQSSSGNNITLKTSVGNANDSHFKFQKSRGGSSAIADVINGDDLGTISWGGYYSGAFQDTSTIRAEASISGSYSDRLLYDSDEHLIRTNNTTRVTINSSGNVGVGTSSPVAKLNISSGDVGFIPGVNADELFLENTDHCGMTIGCGPNKTANIYFGEQGVGVSRGAIVYNTQGDSLAFSTAGLTNEKMRIDSSGRVGIGTSSPATPLHVDGTTATPVVFESSNSQSLINFRNSSTSLFFMGASSNNWNVQTNGVERLSVTTIGNVGIGTSNPLSTLHVSAGSPELIIDKENAVNATGGNTEVVKITAKGQKNGVAGPCGSIIFRQDDATWSSSNEFHKPTRIELCTQDAGTTDQSEVPRLVVDRDGKIGIGTNNPARTFHIESALNNPVRIKTSATYSRIEFESSTSTHPSNVAIGASGDSFRIFTGTNGSNSTRMIVTSSGDVRLANPTADPAYGSATTGVQVKSGVLIINSAGSGNVIGRNTNGGAIFFQRSGSIVGNISVSTTTTSYITSSDYRLKENVVDLNDAVNRVKQLAPKRFNFIADADTTVDGFLAHEAQTVVPEAVTGTKDETEIIGTLTEWDGTVLKTNVTEPTTEELTWEETTINEDGEESTVIRTRTWTPTGNQPVYQGIDQAKLVPLLTAALQEALVKIETLEQRLADAGIE